MMSRFQRESNSAVTHPKPIDECKSAGGGDHEKLAAVHAGNECGGYKECERGNKDSSWEAKRARRSMFFAEDGKSGGNRSVDEQARDDGKHGVAGKISGDGKDHEQHAKNRDGDMRSAKPGMNPSKEGWEISAFAHG